MAAPVIIYIDTTNKAQVASFLTSQQVASQTILEAGDTVPMQLHFLQKNGAVNNTGSTISSYPYSYIDPSTVTPVTLAIGAIGAQPTAGTFTLTYGANTTGAIAYNASAATVATALNALTSITSAGGVTVTGNAGGPYRIVFTTTGVISTLIATDATKLSPTSIGITGESVVGATGISEVQTIRILQSPAAVQNTWTATFGAMSITRLQSGGSGLNEVQRITVPQGTYGGGFSIAFGAASTGSNVYNVTGAALQTALGALSTIGAANVSVIQSSATTWDVTFQGSLGGVSQSLMVANSTGLLMPAYLAANVNLNVQGVFDYLSNLGVNTATATLQIQQGSSVNTVLQASVTLNNSLIQGTPAVPVAANPWQTLSQVNALIAAAAYTLPNATTTTKGGVIVATAGNLAVDGSGNISVPTATSSVLGVVKPDNATIANAAGVLTARTATTSLLGIVQPSGTNITVSGGGVIDTAQDIRITAGPSFGAVNGTTQLLVGGVFTGQKYVYVKNTSGDCNFGVFASGVSFIGSTTATIVQFYCNNSVAMTLDTSLNATFASGIAFSPTTTTTAPAAGGAGALPATPLGYATITIGGVARKFAYYA